MKSTKVVFAACFALFSSIATSGDGWSSGVPVAVQKSDWNIYHLTFIETAGPVNNPANCSNNKGFVIHDNHPSAKAAMAFALTALSTGRKFQCYVLDECSQIDGSVTTFPVCGYYPSVKD